MTGLAENLCPLPRTGDRPRGECGNISSLVPKSSTASPLGSLWRPMVYEALEPPTGTVDKSSVCGEHRPQHIDHSFRSDGSHCRTDIPQADLEASRECRSLRPTSPTFTGEDSPLPRLPTPTYGKPTAPPSPSELFFTAVADRSDWQLHPNVFQQLNDGPWGGATGHTIDLFATSANRQVDRYCTSNHTDTKATAIDAFSIKWDAENGWANPPWVLIQHSYQNCPRRSHHYNGHPSLA